MSPDSTYVMELKLDALDSPRIVTKALALVDVRLRTMSSLQEIIVQVYEDGPSGDIKTKMESYGWTISMIEQVEEWDYDGSLGEFEDYGYLHDNDDYDRDNIDYDIDYDKGFWRRTVDWK